MGCSWWSGGPAASPEAGQIPAEAEGPDPHVAPDGTRLPAPRTIFADRVEMPEDLRCLDRAGSFGCFREVAGARFLRGAQSGDPQAPGFDRGARPEEGPPHEVEVSGFWIQNHPVIAEHVDACLRVGTCKPSEFLTDGGMATVGTDGKGEHPAVGATWEGARQYCAYVGGRLPTEAEWELAARGPEARRFPWGNDPRCPHVVASSTRPPSADSQVDALCEPVVRRLGEAVDDETFRALVDPIGASLEPPELGALCTSVADLSGEALVEAVTRARDRLVDQAPSSPALVDCAVDEVPSVADIRERSPEGFVGLAGGVWEWVADDFAPYPGFESDQDLPWASVAGKKVQKGGSFLSDGYADFRSAGRVGMDPKVKLPDVGFRCAWSPP